MREGATLSPRTGTLRRVAKRFVGERTSLLPWAVLRIGVAVLLLVQGFVLSPYLNDLFGTQAIIEEPIAERIIPSYTPRLSWIVGGLSPLCVDEATAIRLIFTMHLVGAPCMLVGWRTRTAVLVTWLTNLLFKTSGFFTSYGAVEILNIVLLYSLFVPVGSVMFLRGANGRPLLRRRTIWRCAYSSYTCPFSTSPPGSPRGLGRSGGTAG